MYVGNGYTFSEKADFYDDTINETKRISFYVSTKPICYEVNCEKRSLRDVINETSFKIHCSIDYDDLDNYPQIQENHFSRVVKGLTGLEAMHDLLKYQFDYYGQGRLADTWFNETLEQFKDRHIFEGGLVSEVIEDRKVVSW